MSRATDDLVDELHALTFQTIMDEIKGYREAVDEEGNRRPLPVPPALIAQALKALKDNGIDSPVRAAALRDHLAGTLPTFEDVEDAHGVAH